MANSEVYVTFGGDTGALEASLASAKASVTNFQRELNSLARQQAAVGASAESELGQRMLAAAGRLTDAKTAVASLRTELGTVAGGASSAASGVTAVSHAATAGVEGLSFYTRELRALFDELSSGRDRQAIGTFSNLAGHFLAAHAEIIPLVAAFAAFGAALGYAAFQSITLSNAMKSVQLTSVVAQLQMTDTQIAALVDHIKTAANVSNESAGKIAQAFLRLGSGGAELAQIVANYLPMLAREMGEKAPEAAQKLAEMFAELSTKGRAYVADTKGVSAATLQAYDNYVLAGQTAKAYGVIIDAMIARLEASRESLARAAAATKDHGAAIEIAHGAMLAGVDATALLADAQGNLGGATNRATREIDAQISGLQALRGQLAEAGSAASVFAQALGQAAKFDKVGAELRTVSAEMSGMQAALQRATASGDTAAIDQLAAGLAHAGDQFKKLQQQAGDGLLGRDAVAQTEAAIAHLEATWKGSTADKLAAERDVWQQIVAGETSTAEQVMHARTEIESKSREILAAGYRDFQAAEDVKVAAAGKNSAAVIAIRQAEAARAREIFGAGSDEERAAIEQVARAKEQAATRGAAAGAKAAKDELAATLEQALSEVQELEKTTSAKIALYAKEAQVKQITEAQKVSLTLAALAQGETAEQAALQKELANNSLSLKEKQALLDKEKDLQLDYGIAVQKIQEDAAAKATQAWNSAMTSINGAMDSQVKGLLTGTENWHTAFKNVLTDLTVKTIEFFVNWGLQQAENVAKSILLDNTLVAAHVTGAAAMAAADQGAASAGLVADIGSVIKSIEAFAGEVGAAVAAFLAPVIGPAAVPAGAAAAAGVVAMGNVYDSGAWSVPNDMVAGIHAGEMIIPQRGGIASEFRSFMAAGGFAGAPGASPAGGQGAGTTHNHTWNVDARNANDPDAVVDTIRSRAKDVIPAHLEIDTRPSPFAD